jgi:diguanylate cyclase (GGDEF)-like protein/PAS domain S-box-containing protein
VLPKLLLALLSSLATLVYLRLGAQVLRLAPRNRLNQVFSLVCLALAFWSFAYTLLPTAHEANVWFWYGLSSPGWTLAPSLLLHFFILLGGRQTWLRKWWSLPAIYLPGLYFFAIALLGPGHLGVESFVSTRWGWSEVYGDLTPAFALYLLFFSGFILFGLWIVYQSGRKAELIWKRKQSEVVVLSGLVVLPLVSISGILLPWLGIRDIPELSHVFAGVWILAIRYAMSHYHLLLLTPAIAAQDILRTIQDAVVLLDRDHRVVNVNPAAEQLFGAAGEEMVGSEMDSVFDNEGPEAALALRAQLDHDRADPIDVTLRNESGRRVPTSISCSRIRDEHGQNVGTVLVLRDITSQKRIEEELRFTATHDPLTGLPNRALFQDRLLQAIERGERSESLFAVLLVDLDKFKDINDSLGHDVGDAVLQEVGRRLQHAVRAVDTVSRLAGDEFLIILEDLDDPSGVNIVIQRVLKLLSLPISVREHRILSTASIGVSLFPADGSSAQVLLQKADLALYNCKRNGSGLFEFFSAEMEEANRKRIAIERGLQTALARGELFVLYQPMVDLACQRVTAVEALLRWRSPDLGLLNPLEFIPIAERTGLILPIGEWVLRTACRQCREWQLAGAPALPISVNVSVRQLWQSDFVETVSTVLRETELDPTLLEIELTESIALGSSERAAGVVSRLGELGVRIVIDDFGTGHSSLARLRQLHMHAIKIDRAFIKNIASEDRDRDLVSTIIAMAHKLNVGVIAEGVETREQVSALQAIAGSQPAGSDLRRLQGFLFSKPVPSEVISSLLERAEQSGFGAESSGLGTSRIA